MSDINLLSSQQSQPQQPVVQQIDPKTIPAGTIRPRQLQAGYAMIKVGLAAHRPVKTNEVVFWFSTDTLIMSYWTGTAWKSGSAFS